MSCDGGAGGGKKIIVNNFYASLVFRTMGYRLAIRGGLLLSDLCVGLGRKQFSTFYFTARVLCMHGFLGLLVCR